MTYIYIRCENKFFDKLLESVEFDFDLFPVNKNSQITYKKSAIEIFVLNELKFGVSNKIYRWENKKLLFIDNDNVKESLFPETNSGKLFYNSFTISGQINLDDFTVPREEFGNFVSMIINSKKLFEVTETTIEIFIKSGNIHVLLQFYRYPNTIVDLYDKWVREGKYYGCSNQSQLYDAIGENMKAYEDYNFYTDPPFLFEEYNERLLMYSFIALNNLDSHTKEKDFEKIIQICRRAHNVPVNLFNFYGDQIFGYDWRTKKRRENFKMLSILKQSSKLIAEEIIKIDDIRLGNYLARFLLGNFQKGDEIPEELFTRDIIFPKYKKELRVLMQSK